MLHVVLVMTDFLYYYLQVLKVLKIPIKMYRGILYFTLFFPFLKILLIFAFEEERSKMFPFTSKIYFQNISFENKTFSYFYLAKNTVKCMKVI